MSRGFGFVGFASSKEAAEAIAQMNGRKIDGRYATNSLKFEDL
jgi:RNA recognition motif-containing protein